MCPGLRRRLTTCPILIRRHGQGNFRAVTTCVSTSWWKDSEGMQRHRLPHPSPTLRGPVTWMATWELPLTGRLNSGRGAARRRRGSSQNATTERTCKTSTSMVTRPARLRRDLPGRPPASSHSPRGSSPPLWTERPNHQLRPSKPAPLPPRAPIRRTASTCRLRRKPCFRHVARPFQFAGGQRLVLAQQEVHRLLNLNRRQLRAYLAENELAVPGNSQTV